MDEFLILLQAKLDEAKSKGNVNADIKELQNQLDKLKVQVELDPKATQKLADDIGKLLNQKITISNINIDTKSGIKAGQEYGKQISQGISQGMSSASKSTEKVLRDFSELNEAKRKFVDGHDLISKDDIADAEKLYDTVRKAFSEFGQVTVSKGSMNDGSLENMRVKIEQVNGEMKITRDFMLYFNESKNGFKLVDDDTIRTTEKMVQHLNEEKNIINATNEEANAIKEKLAEQEKYYGKLGQATKEQIALEKQRITAGEKQLEILEEQAKRRDSRISYNEGQIDKKGLSDVSRQRKINDLEYSGREKIDIAFGRELDKSLISLSKLKETWQEQGIYVDEFKAKVESLEKSLNEITIGDVKGLNTFKEQISSLSFEAKQLSQIHEIQLSMDTGETESKIEALISRTNQWTDTEGKARISTESLTNALDKLGIASNEYLKTPTEERQKALIEANEQLSIEYKKVASELRSMNAEFAKDSAIDSLRQQYQTFYSENGKAHKVFGNQLKSAISELAHGAEVPKQRVAELKRELLDAKNACKELGLTGQTWFQSLGDKIKQLSTYLSGTVIIGKLLQTGKEMVDNVSKIDTSLMELEKVSDLTADGLERVTDRSFKLGKSLAKTGTDVLDAVTTFKRAGYDIEDSMSYAEQALKTTNISENLKDAGQAADSIVNIMKGFKNETPEFATKINDAVNQVSNTEAVDFDNLIDGATRLSAVADQAGMSFEQMLGTLTGGYEILGNMEKVATGQITIFSRLQAIQLDGEEEVSTVAKLQETFNNATKGAVNIVDQTTGQLRNVYDILDDVANVWDELDKNTREALAIEAAGIRQKNVFLAMMQNWEGVKDAVESASDSVGSADVENEKYIKSIQGRVENFERSVQQLSRTVLDSDIIKWFVDLGTTCVNAIDKIVNTFGSLGTIGLGAGLFTSIKNVGIFKTFQSDLDGISNKIGFSKRSFAEWGKQVSTSFKESEGVINSFKNALKTAFTVPIEKNNDWIKNNLGDIVNKENIDTFIPKLTLENSKKLTEQIREQSIAVANGSKNWDGYFNELEKQGQGYIVDLIKNTDDLSKLTGEDLVKANQQARASALAHNEAIKAQTLSAKASKVALKGLSVVANTITSIGLSLVASKVVSFIYDMATANEKLLNSAKELSNGFVQEKETIEDYKNKIEELKSIIDDNSSSYDKVSQARKDLMVVQDELIKKFGTEKETIDIITNAINDQSNALDELTKKQYQQWKNNFNDKSFAQSASDFLSSDNIGNAIYKLTEFDFSGAWEMLTAPTESNIDKMVDSMQYAYYKIEKTGNDTLDSLIAKTYDLYDDGSNFILDGNLDDIYEDLLEVQNLANDFDVSDSFETSITKVANAMDKTLKSYKEAYDTYILYEKILNESNTNQYDEQFNLINKAKEAYDNAVVSGNQNKIEEASDEYAKTLQSAIDLAMGNYDYDVADYFKAMYPELQQMFGEWQFSLNFEPNTDGLQDKVADALDSIDGVSDGTTSFSVEDIENFNPNVATQEQIDAYGELTNVAETYGLTVKQLITLLQTMGLIQSESYQQLVDTFGQDNVDKLSPEDLEIAYTIKNVGSMTFEQLQAEIQKVKDSTNENPISSISSTIDQLNTQLKPTFDSLKSAYQDIFTDGGFTLENVDLSMLDSIKSKLDELNELEGANISIDYSSFDNLVRVLTDSSSKSWEVQKAFDSLATSVLNSTDVMDSMDESTIQLVASMLESMGVANANEVAYEAFNAKMEGLALQEQLLAETGKELANVTADDADAFLNHAGASEVAKTYLFQLVAAEQVFNAQGLDVSGKIEKLKELATAYGQTAIAAKIAHMEDQNAKAHTSFTDSDYQMLVDEVNNAVNNVQVDFGNIGGGSKSAGGAGKEAADAYLEAFEKELKDLDDLKDRGKITEKQYLDALRRLYLKYFRDKEKYLKEYEKYEHQYLEGMKSLYESAFSYITKQIDKRIDAVNSQKDAAVSALEAERDARLEAIEAQKEQYEHEIEGIEAQIEAKEKEIKAMQDANGERKRAIDLQKAEYELQRMQNQKTSFVYKDGQMVYEADTSGIRDAKQEVEDKKLEIDISKIEKEIDLLEEQKDLLQDQIDLLEKQADQINKYYDQLIADTEKHYDTMIKGLEDYKSQFEELTDIVENAQLEASLSELGINMDALLSGSQEEFEKLKTAYIGILADMSRGNDGVLEQLSRLSGISTESISYLDATKSAFDDLGSVTLEGLEESVDGIGESASTLSTSVGEASTAVGNIQESVSNMSQSIAPLNTELGNLKTLISELIVLLNDITFPEIGDEGYAQKLRDIAQAFGEIASKCGEFKNIDFSSIIGSASASGMDGAATTDGEGMGVQTGTGFMGLAFAISESVTTIDEQMDNLQKALDIGNDSFAEQIRVITEEYIPAWEELQNRLAEIIGVGGGDGDNKEGKGSKKSGSKDGNSESGGNDGSIIGIMQTGGEEVATRLEDPWLKAFNDFATDGDNSVQTVCDKIIELVSEMARIIQEKCEAAASALNALAKTAESSLSAAGGSRSGNTVSGNPIFVSPNAKGTVGHAFAEGTGKYKGLAHDEKYALRSEYGQPELTVYPDGTAELTTEPVMSDLPKGTVIFNEEQTKRIMGNKGEELGNAYDEGTVILADGTELRPLNPGDKEYWMVKKFDEFFKNNRDALLMPANAMFQVAESVDKMVDVINNNHSTTQNITVNIGDINLQEVQDVNSLSREIVLRMPNMLLQEMHRI